MFLKGTAAYSLTFQKLKEFKERLICTSSSAFTKERSLQSSLTFTKHIKENNSMFDDIFII